MTKAVIGRLITPIFAISFAGLFLWATRNMSGDAANYPRLVVTILLPLAAIALLGALRDWRRDGSKRYQAFPDEPMTRSQWIKTAGIASLLIVYVWLVPIVGFYEATLPFLIASFVLLGVRKPLPLLAYTGGTLLGAWLLFTRALGVFLPTGLNLIG